MLYWLKENNIAITSNYGGGSISVVSLKDGKLTEVVQVQLHIDKNNIIIFL